MGVAAAPVPAPSANSSREFRAEVTEWLHEGDEVGGHVLALLKQDIQLYAYARSLFEKHKRANSLQAG
jgi:hypothetical protein